MYNTTKKILVWALMLTFTLSSAYATWMTNSWVTTDTTMTQTTVEAFSMKEVKVVDQDTLIISFNKDLLEDTSLFEFLLTPKADDTREIIISSLVLSGSSELSVDTQEPLTPNEEYNLVVVFASDVEGNVIENGVDGMVTFTTPETFAVEIPVEDLNAAPSEEVPAMDVAPVDVANTEVSSWVTTEVAATTAEALPQTGPAEMMIVILAMMLGLGFMYSRRRA